MTEEDDDYMDFIEDQAAYKEACLKDAEWSKE